MTFRFWFQFFFWTIGLDGSCYVNTKSFSLIIQLRSMCCLHKDSIEIFFIWETPHLNSLNLSMANHEAQISKKTARSGVHKAFLLKILRKIFEKYSFGEAFYINIESFKRNTFDSLLVIYFVNLETWRKATEIGFNNTYKLLHINYQLPLPMVVSNPRKVALLPFW